MVEDCGTSIDYCTTSFNGELHTAALQAFGLVAVEAQLHGIPVVAELKTVGEIGNFHGFLLKIMVIDPRIVIGGDDNLTNIMHGSQWSAGKINPSYGSRAQSMRVQK